MKAVRTSLLNTMSLLMKHIGERKAGRERVGMDQTLSILSNTNTHREQASEPEIQNEVHLRASGSGSGTAPTGLRPHTPVA
jgi:hypothetical protein